MIGGLDPTGGAGLLRDGWTVQAVAPQLRQLAVVTASTRQGGDVPVQVGPVDPRGLARALARLAAAPRLRALKIGMLPPDAVALVEALVLELRRRERPPSIVLDPVLRATAGGSLGAASSLLALARHVDLITPNRDELGALAQALRADGQVHAHASEALAAGLGVAVLAKGEAPKRAPLAAPLAVGRVCDRLLLPNPSAGPSQRLFERPRCAGPDPRGTGCALATAIACGLARGQAMTEAVAAAIAWLDAARRHLHPGRDGRPHLPWHSSQRP
nr:bifunctional hydroxymethylpyrimidine kinase/phosphomethylpyrimidine kinase [Pseudenhygromyxa sp. WMMC2535]